MRFVERLFAGEGPYGALHDTMLLGTIVALSVRGDPWRVNAVAGRALAALNRDEVAPALTQRLKEIDKRRGERSQRDLEHGNKGRA